MPGLVPGIQVCCASSEDADGGEMASHDAHLWFGTPLAAPSKEAPRNGLNCRFLTMQYPHRSHQYSPVLQICTPYIFRAQNAQPDIFCFDNL
jgi:hypothetical protein